jgi:hypothetical protein
MLIFAIKILADDQLELLKARYRAISYSLVNDFKKSWGFNSCGKIK